MGRVIPFRQVGARAGAMLAVFGVALTGACATARSSLPLRPLDVAPYSHTYAFRRVTDTSVIGHLPIQADPSLSAEELSSDVMRKLLEEMTDLLDSARWTVPLSPVAAPAREAPDPYVGRSDSLYRLGLFPYPPMVVSGWNPSKRWRTRLMEVAGQKGAGFVLWISLGISRYAVHQKPGLTLNKEVQLGVNHTVPVSWLNAIDEPVPVLHLIGALLTRDGEVLRVAAEGLLARRPNLVLSVLGVEQVFIDDDIRDLLERHRREDVADQPLTWRVALQNLVGLLLGRDELIVQ